MRYLLIMVLALLGCGANETTTGGNGGLGGETSQGGGGGSTCSDPHDASCVPYKPEPVEKTPVAFGPECKASAETAVQAIIPGDGLTDESGNTLSENGALAIRCEPIATPTEIDSVEYGAYRGFGGICDAVTHDVYVWALPDLPASVRPKDADVTAHVEASEMLFDPHPAFEGDEYRRSVDVGLSVESGFVCFGVTMAVQGEARLCAIGCGKTEVESPDLDLYSDTIGGTVQCPDADGNCALEPMAVSPTEALGAQYDGPTRKMRFRWYGKQ